MQCCWTSCRDILQVCFSESQSNSRISRGQPPTPPSPSAETEKADFSSALKTLAKDINFLIIFFAFGIGVGSFYAVSTLLDQILQPYGYDSVGHSPFCVDTYFRMTLEFLDLL